MQKFFDNVVDKNGHVLAGASVTVTDAATGALSTIYSNNSLGIKANPITCDSNGYFEFYAANGRYNIDVTGAGLQTRHVTDVLLEDITGTGAGLVGFTPAGTGAVVRTSQDKMREWVSPFDFGAIADGSSHPLSGRYGSLGAAQAVYPFVTSLSQEIDWAACTAAIKATASYATFSFASGFNGVVFTSPFWAAAKNPLLRFPAGFYELGSDELYWTGDNIVADLRGAVFNYRGTGNAFRWQHLTYGNLLGGQVQLFSDTAATYGLHLDGSNRWNAWRDFLITFSGTYDPATFSKPTATSNVGIYADSGGAPPDANTFARDSIYNLFEDYRVEKCGWNVHLLNDPLSPSSGGAVLAQNVFHKGVHHARNGIWLEGAKGVRFLNIVQESSDAASVALRLKTSGANGATSNLIDFQHFEYPNLTTFDIDAGSTYNELRCQLDPYSAFLTSTTAGRFQNLSTTKVWQRVTTQGDRIILDESGRLVLSRSASTYTPTSGYVLQIEGNGLLGASGGGNNHKLFVGTNEQVVVAHDGGVGGLSLMGTGATSSANLVWGNNFGAGGSERWRASLDGSDNSLNFGAGATWKGAAATPVLKLFNNAVAPGANNTIPLGSSALTWSNGFFNKIKVTPVTVAALPSASTAGAGTKAFVSDANATTFASIVAGGGANNIPVYSDGTNWRIG